ncbi:nitroreductase family protein [Bradyrhizobium sp. WSM 1738]|uniref:nitroreductase family protein n=1 Tax=Bradyrhizobium hereditatis TaxID=2821405 RepID=UPI001CE335C9|nr:nitroreductase family protein [Bradyrhizobium hereditatis]MCA6119360.1 nitroreductase family protein [Bradyrhizobium hereditatis]
MSNSRTPLADRFGADAADIEFGNDAPSTHRQLAARGSVRKFRPDTVPYSILRRLCALALCAPTKSDLQQRDIIIIDAPSLKSQIAARLIDGPLGQKWLADIPNLLIFCGNNRRQRQIHTLRDRHFANDHLDAFFNAAVDAAIALSAFVIAAEAEGLGVCPISAVRNHADTLSQLLELPDHVFPVAGLAVGYPAETPQLSIRLPLSVTVHRNAFEEDGLDAAIEAYDRRREAAQPYTAQRYVREFGLAETYGWSEDKARQYARPERADFGAYVRRIGFNLD